MLKVMKLTKRYGKIEALKNIDIDFDCGLYALLGPNGSGKSTLLNCLVVSIAPTSGRIQWNGEEIRSLGKVYRKLLGFVPQQQGLYESFTGRHFLAYLATLKDISKSEMEKELDRVLKLVQLEEEADRMIGTYSGGMKQRLLIAQAVLGNPSILILDEPTAGLDPKERSRMKDLFSKLAADSIVLIATHMVSDIEDVAKEIFLLGEGEILASGSSKELTRELENQIYILEAAAEELERIRTEFSVLSVVYEKEQIRARIHSKKPPISWIYHQDSPRLEDVYLSYFQEEEACYATSTL